MGGYASAKAEFDKLDVKVVAASVDPLEKAQEVARELNFPIGYGVARDVADRLGSWWEERRQIIQPSEFILNAENKVMASSYSDGPLGRIDAGDVIRLVNFYQSQKK